jgi:hypothetical protein
LAGEERNVREIEAIYNRIGTDMVRAARERDKGRVEALIQLVVALEAAYPKEMAELRSSP